MNKGSSRPEFDRVVLPHLDAAVTLARWLTRSAADAEDVVQEAMMRAFTYFAGFRGDNARGWLLQIVRNTAYASAKLNRGPALTADGAMPEIADPAENPEGRLIAAEGHSRVMAALSALPAELRETLLLREVEELAYKEIARITDAPIGTVMSRLWRARRLLAGSLARQEDVA